MTNAEKNNVLEWLETLDKASSGKHYPALFDKVHGIMARPSRRRGAVSTYKINKHTKEGDNVIVPAKVLSTGTMDHKINIAALEYSEKALSHFKAKGCRVMDIKEMISQSRISIIV
jgi:large subunit ribosomal protein L18e